MRHYNQWQSKMAMLQAEITQEQLFLIFHCIFSIFHDFWYLKTTTDFMVSTSFKAFVRSLCGLWSPYNQLQQHEI